VKLIATLQPKEVGLPIHAYVGREQVKPEGTERAQQVFVHVATHVKHTEVEEIGVEHLLKDVKDATISTLSTEVGSKAQVRVCNLPACYGHFRSDCY
jgi:26S proteasome regulatory subunit N8